MTEDELGERAPDFRDAWFPDEDLGPLAVKVRTYRLWDEEQYQRMLSTAGAVIRGLDPAELASGDWDGIFVDYIQWLTDFIQNPVMLDENSFDPPITDYDPYVQERVARLQVLRSEYLSRRDG